MKPLLAILFVVGLVLAYQPAHSGAQIRTDVTVTIRSTATEVVLGETLDLHIDVSNSSAADTPPLVIHIDITDPASETSVDPEDWTPTLSRSMGVLQPGQTHSLAWTVQPISAGTYSIYAVSLSPGFDNGAISNIVGVDVVDQRSLDPNGILPVAIAIPTVIGGLLAVRLRRNH